MSPQESIEHLCHGFDQPLKPHLLCQRTWAVVGAHTNPDKYGFKIVHRLNLIGYKVFPINQSFTEVDGLTCYPSLSALSVVPQVVNLVVNPTRGLETLKEAAELGIRLIWSQPGTHNEALQALADQLGLCVLQDCVLASTADQLMGSDDDV